jgi:DNA-binding MarR family transcriptional regulator
MRVATDNWRDDDLVMAWSALLRLHAALVPVLDADVQRTGVPLSWYDVLLELSTASPDGMRMAELGDAVVLSRSRVSRVVDELEQAGLVRRVPNPDDRRSSYATLTEQGRAQFRKAAPVYLESIRRRLGARLSARDARLLRRLLETALRDHGAP